MRDVRCASSLTPLFGSIPDTIGLVFGKLTTGDVGAQMLSLHLLDAVMKRCAPLTPPDAPGITPHHLTCSPHSCKGAPPVVRKALKQWEAYVADRSRAPQVREKALELTDLWSRSLGGPYSDTASALQRLGHHYKVRW